MQFLVTFVPFLANECPVSDGGSGGTFPLLALWSFRRHPLNSTNQIPRASL